jgi:formate hydrogenlyase subunit 3/multisubunit Na+/H+ antiporter MnhD subunit
MTSTFIFIFKLSLLLSLGLFLIPKNWKYAWCCLLQILITISSTTWAIEVFRNGPIDLLLGIDTWSGTIHLTIDTLSAYFIIIINFICICGMIYAGGYLKPYLSKKRAVIISIHLFSFVWLHGAMILVASVQDGIAFLVAWELMSLFSFILVIFEAQKESTLKTGINYLLQMHLSFALIMIGFLVAANITGNLGFAGVGKYFAEYHNVGLFLLFFAGFGIKAGFIPLHTWLPRAHPAAPSHVSAVMSGVMIKMGIYGILRVTSLVQHEFMPIGIIVLSVAIVTGILGVVMAIMQHDLKKLLAYHSIENIGIIGIGLGVSILGKAVNDPLLIMLGMAGALLHVMNHALFKSLLFFTAGNVFYATHTVNMDKLGGIARNMRLTSIAFLIGALAISGIPPFNGFISEFFIYSGLIGHLTHATFVMSLIGVAAVISLVLIGGLCIYCFTKAFGLNFLGTRRSAVNQTVEEVPASMLIPAGLIIIPIIAIGMFPGFFGKNILMIAEQVVHVPAGEVEGNIIHSLTSIGYVNMAMALTLVVIAGIKAWQQARVKVQTGPTWGCGYTAGDFRHQYTPTSYADSLKQLAEPVIDYTTHYKSFTETEIFPPEKKFYTESKDLIEEKTILSWVYGIVRLLPKAGIAQTGMINHYLIYPMLFLIIIGLLTILNVM